MLNKFYDRPSQFILIKVKFSNADGKRYTYAAHVKHGVKPGDWVTVPTGRIENVFQAVGGYRHLSIGEVTAVTDDLSKLPKDMSIKHIVNKVKGGEFYDKILKAKLRR